MIIDKVTLNNFLCHEAFSLELGAGHFFIRGKNGSGKSSLFDAITYTLWRRARMLDRRGGGQKRLIRYGAKSAGVEIDFSLGGSYKAVASIGKKRQVFRGGDMVAVGDETLDYLAKTICSFEMFAASAFRAQKPGGSLLTLEPKLRVQKLADIIGCSFDNVIATLTGKKVETNASIKQLKILQPSSPVTNGDIDGLQQRHTELSNALAQMPDKQREVSSLWHRRDVLRPITKESFDALDHVEKQIIITAVRVEQEKATIQQLRDTLKQWAGVYNAVGDFNWDEVQKEKIQIDAQVEQLENIQRERATVHKELNQVAGMIANEKRYTEINQKMRQAQGELVKMEGVYHDVMDLLSFFGPKGMMLVALRGALVAIEERANAFLEEFHYSIRITDKFDVEVSDSRGTRMYEALSGGEEMLVDIALRIGLVKMFRDFGIQLDCCLIDEGMGSLDKANLSLFAQMLERLSGQYKQSVIISHVDFDLSGFQEIWMGG